MKRVLLAILFVLGMAQVVSADSINTVAGSTTTGAGRITVTVYNDAGATLVSGAPVVWDNDDTEYDRSGYPYITTTTTADSPHTAGVMLTDSCTAGSLCEIVTEGWAVARRVGTVTEDTVISTSTTASSIGDATSGNNVCYLGVALENVDVLNGGAACTAGVVCAVPIQVHITCVP